MRRSKQTLFGCIAVAIALPVSFAGCSSGTTTAVETSTTVDVPLNQGQTVNIIKSGSKNVFDPKTVTVKTGSVITFKNNSASTHTIVTDTGQAVDFNSDTLEPTKTFVKTIDKPGTYTYYCLIHSKEVMSGSIVVTP